MSYREKEGKPKNHEAPREWAKTANEVESTFRSGVDMCALVAYAVSAEGWGGLTHSKYSDIFISLMEVSVSEGLEPSCMTQTLLEPLFSVYQVLHGVGGQAHRRQRMR